MQQGKYSHSLVMAQEQHNINYVPKILRTSQKFKKKMMKRHQYEVTQTTKIILNKYWFQLQYHLQLPLKVSRNSNLIELYAPMDDMQARNRGS